MIQMTLHLQSCHTPLNAPQFSNLFVFCPLHIFTNHCVSSENAFRVIDWLNQDKYQFWFINSYKQDACETNYSLTFSKYFEHCSFSIFLDFFHFCSVHSFPPAFFSFLTLFYSRSHSIHSFTPFTWVFVLLPAGLAFCFVFYFLFILGPLHVIVFFFFGYLNFFFGFYVYSFSFLPLCFECMHKYILTHYYCQLL